nr:uncharacterized protein LOC123752348 [Procambarus clarkii]
MPVLHTQQLVLRVTLHLTSAGTLSELATLQVSGNPITFPPPDVIKGGTRAILRFLKEKCDAEENSDGLPTSSPAAGEVEPLGNHPGSTPDAKRRSESLRESSFDDQDGEESESAVWCGWYSEGEGRQARVAENAPESHYEGDESDDGDETSRNSSVHSTSFRIAIKAGGDSVVEQDLHLGLQEEPDSERDTLGRPPSSTSACLLTPNFEFPTRPEYDLTREDSSSDRGLAEGPCRPEDDPSIATWSCTCFQDPSPITRDKMHIFGRSPDSTSKHRFLKTLPDTLESLLLPVGSIMVPSMAPGHIGGHRRTLHLHLQGDNHHLEDDMESLEGDLGEGYRRPHSEPFCDIEKECHRKVSCVSLPVVSLQLPALEGHLLQERGPRPGLASNRRIARRPRPGAGSRRTQKEHHKPKLVTVAEVHRRAREARRRQREMLAATREMNASQRLKSVAGLEDWREEAKQLQLQQQYHHTLHPNAYLPAVCEAPFAIDGTMLTPRARSKIKTKEDQKRSLSPSVSQVTGVCAGVRSCLEELSTAAGGAAGGEEGGSLAHTASIVTQLHHLRRQLNRLKVNCVI